MAKKTYSVLLDDEVVALVQELAEKMDKSFSAMLRFLVLEGLKNRN